MTKPNPTHWQAAAWPAPAVVKAGHTLRRGGVSVGPWGAGDGSGGLNVGDHCGDNPEAVRRNRALLASGLPGEPCWLDQVHGVAVREVAHAPIPGAAPIAGTDGAVTTRAGVVLAVMSADCLPVLLCDRAATVVGAAHAGWRGLVGGVLEQLVARASPLAGPGAQWLAWMGPAIGPGAFEVGEEVREAFVNANPRAAAGFVPGAQPGKWMADLYGLARQRLADCGVQSVFGGGQCTVADPERYYSYRRDGLTGRLASLIWIDRPD